MGGEKISPLEVDAAVHSVQDCKPYRGLLVRYRYGERTYTNTQIYGGVPLFKYNRAQLEYDF